MRHPVSSLALTNVICAGIGYRRCPGRRFFFYNDRDTGLYKLARSSSGMFYVWFNAAHQVYLPRFLNLLTHGRIIEYAIRHAVCGKQHSS